MVPLVVVAQLPIAVAAPGPQGPFVIHHCGTDAADAQDFGLDRLNGPRRGGQTQRQEQGQNPR